MNGFDSEESLDTHALWLTGLASLVRHRSLIGVGTLLCGLSAAGISLAMPEVFSSRTVFLPPQQGQNSGAASALAAATGGNLTALAGAGLRTPADQMVALMQSETITDRIIDSFDLMKVYGVDYRFKARRVLASQVTMNVGRRDGLVTVEVLAHTPQVAADIANRYVEELRRLTSKLALTEAQQRRVFFEQQVKDTKTRLVQAQQDLLSSGYSDNVLKAEPRAVAEGYAKARAELTITEARLQALRSQLADSTPEVLQQGALVAALRQRLAAQEQIGEGKAGTDYAYFSKYREYKYQESLLDLFSRQFETARVEEAREGALIQVVDRAQPPERRVKPVRSQITIAGLLGGLLLTGGFALASDYWRRWRSNANAQRAWQEAMGLEKVPKP